MSLLVQLSDPHIDLGPEDTGSAEALAATVRAVTALDPAPDAVLVSGDLTNAADARSYERVHELLTPLAMPVHVLAGNHDDRAGLRERFAGGAVEGSGGEPFRYAARCGAVRLVGCDTTVPGRPGGRLDGEALAWLETTLAAEPTTPTIVAMHHAPLLLGIGPMDAIGLPAADRAALKDVIGRFAGVRRIIAGHVHRASFGRLGACPVFTCPSTHLELRLDTGPEIDLEPAPPAFALHRLLASGEIVTLLQPVGAG